ncbi:ribosome biogenesis GTPase Der [Buchnera aphidicola (Neophyllaphis podocarpi)]|uniref:ribosome biogenesis GTPase Der n=1 Tax=Buchnera aphidicola TaxID=9 RepID=UPI0031B8A8CD
MKPVIAIVGKTNVGKSTLFNLLNKTNKSIVGNTSGLTRDRKYGTIKIKEKRIILIDTIGIDYSDKRFLKKTNQQLNIAIKESNIIMFILDARTSIIEKEKTFFQKLRKLNKDIFLIINKIDKIKNKNINNEFFDLGNNNIFFISSTQNKGIEKILKKIKNYKFKDEKKKIEFKKEIKVSIIGVPNVGKSTLINCIIKDKNRLIHSKIPGSTIDNNEIKYYIKNNKYILIDTAGIKRKSKIKNELEKKSIKKTIYSIKISSLSVILIDATKEITKQEIKIINLVLNLNKGLIILINKCDKIKEKEKEKIKEKLKSRINFLKFIKILYISAKENTGVKSIFKYINKIYELIEMKISPNKITKIIKKATTEHKPPINNGKKTKLKFAHQSISNRSIIVIHGSNIKNLNNSYKRYLENYLQKELKIFGLQIFLKFKEQKDYSKSKK